MEMMKSSGKALILSYGKRKVLKFTQLLEMELIFVTKSLLPQGQC